MITVTFKDRLNKIMKNVEENNAKNTVFTSIAGFGPYFSTDNCGGFDKQNAYLFIGDRDLKAVKLLRSYLLHSLALKKNKILVQDPGYLYRDDFSGLLSLNSSAEEDIEDNILWGRLSKLKENAELFKDYDISWHHADDPEELFSASCLNEENGTDVVFISLSYEDFIKNPVLPKQIAQKKNCIVIAFIDKKEEKKNKDDSFPIDENIEEMLCRLCDCSIEDLSEIACDINFVTSSKDEEFDKAGNLIKYDLIDVFTLSKVHSYILTHKEYHYHDKYLEWHVREAD